MSHISSQQAFYFTPLSEVFFITEPLEEKLLLFYINAYREKIITQEPGGRTMLPDPCIQQQSPRFRFFVRNLRGYLEIFILRRS